MKLNIIIAGVGGQGTLLASRVLGNYATLMGYDCKLSEVHGMAQRGGSVVTYVKYDKKVYSPIIADGDADILLAFEELEALRFSHTIKKGAHIIVNTQKIMPLPVITGAMEYPNDCLEKLASFDNELITIDAHSMALDCGNSRVANTIMIGKLAKILGFDKDILTKALVMSVPQKVLDVNLLALAKGFE